MLRYLLLIFVLLSACGQKKQVQEYKLPQINDINEVVTEVIRQDNLSSEGLDLNCSLSKLKVVFKKSSNNGLRPRHDPRIFTLPYYLPEKYSTNSIFLKIDSLYLLRQNDIFRKFSLDQSFTKLIHLTNESQIKKKSLPNSFVANCRYEITIPIFSRNRTLAYVKLTEACNVLGGSAWAIYLNKIHGRWQIIKQSMLWIG